MNQQLLRQTTFHLFLFALFLLFSSSAVHAEDPNIFPAGAFSSADISAELPDKWESLEFPNIKSHTSYLMVTENGSTVVRAESSASASGLIRRLDLNPLRYPLLTWCWKIANVYKKGDVTKKEGDDYPARVYITFADLPGRTNFWDEVKATTVRLFSGKELPKNAINYIWASKAPKGLITPNPYTGRVKMIVVESGDAKANQWIEEKRDIVADYRQAFGTDPPPISGIAIMTDSDNTGETAVAWYGDISFSGKP
jgi:hypothetical protein